MKFRIYREEDWKQLHALYNRILYRDQVTEEFFLEHLILSPNFQPEGIWLAEENRQLIGAAVSQIVSRPLFPWQSLSKDPAGSLMPLLVDSERPAAQLLEQSENYFRSCGCSRVQTVSAGPTLFPDGIDFEAYPLIHSILIDHSYRKSSVHFSMRCDLDSYHIPEEITARKQALAAQGITAGICSYDDLPAVRRFLENGDLQGRLGNFANKLQRNELHEVIIIRNSTDVLGFCQYNYYGLQERVGPFGVTAAMRGQGIGQVMVAELLETMQRRGFQLAYFASCSEANTHFYAKNNFRIFRTKNILIKEL